MIEFLILILIVTVVVVASQNSNRAAAARLEQTQAHDAEQGRQRDAHWLRYIASFRPAATSDDAKRVIDTMIAGGTVEDVSKPAVGKGAPLAASAGGSLALRAAETAALSYEVSDRLSGQTAKSGAAESTNKTDKIEPAKPLDGTLLLLYFGAFLFVASVGLFVAFGEFSGAVRTLLVVLTMAILYGGGLWLHKQTTPRTERLKPAGIAFVAIGLAIAPLVGVAAYNYLGSGLDARVIWLLTSLLCIGMYAHALLRLRTALLSYLFIFSFISLFESSIAVLHVPVPYFIWGLIIVGMVLRFISIRHNNSNGDSRVSILPSELLDEPAGQSAQLLVPLSTAGTLFMIPEHGVGQVSVGLLLASLYYLLEAYASRQINSHYNSAYVTTAHILGVAAIATGTYAIADKAQTVALVMLGLAAIHVLALFMIPSKLDSKFDDGPDGVHAKELATNGATIAFAIPVVATALAWPNGGLVSIGLAAVVVMGMLIALRQRRVDAFVGGAVALIALPVAIGQLLADPSFTYGMQSAASFVVAIGLVLITDRMYGRYRLEQGSGQTQTTAARPSDTAAWLEPAAVLCVLATTVAVVPAWLEAGWTGIIGSLGAGLALAYLAKISRDSTLWTASGVVLCVPIALSLGLVEASIDDRVFTVAVLVALAGNLLLAVIRQQGSPEPNRWLATGLALLLPVAIGAGGLGFVWSAVGYVYGYLAVMAGLVACRAIAKQRALASSRSATTIASFSYAGGYLVAAVLAVCISLTADASQLHTSIVLASLLVLSIALSVRVEAKREILAFSPWLAQALLVSLIRPVVEATSYTDEYTYGVAYEVAADVANGTMNGTVVILLGTFLAAGLYMLAHRPELSLKLGAATHSIRQSTLVAAYLPIWFGVFYREEPLVLPLSLAVAGCLTAHYFWQRSQQAREASLGIIVLAGLWALLVLDVDNLQIYTHIIAATFAAYAYWRYQRTEIATSDAYLQAMFFVATVPLALQALGGNSGDIYGWLLIIQQVGFMVLGVSIHRKFLTWWGLYVSVAAILYQLRDLGWAALTVLALFVIGIAVYRLSRATDQEPPKQPPIQT